VKYVTLGSSILAVILVGAFAGSAQANGCDKLSFLTFSTPVSLPGVALPAGTYQFTHPDCSSIDHILRVSSQDGRRVYATLLAIPETRPTASDQALVVFGEMPAGSPKAVKAWFYPGETIGDELIYPKGEARRIADAGGRNSSATGGVQR
jgi:hypothetical protein